MDEAMPPERHRPLKEMNMKSSLTVLPSLAMGALLLSGCGPKCPLDPSIKADDPRCVACSHDAKILKSNAACNPCKLNPSIAAGDPQCKPCQWNPSIIASDAKCVEPKKDTVTAPAPAAPPTATQAAAPKADLQKEMDELLSGSAYFDYNASTLKPEGHALLRKIGEFLKDHRSASVRIEGNCDERGSDEYNLALGEKRAKAAESWLRHYGVKASQLSVISYGKEKPADPGHDESAWSKNRRDGFSGTAN
jgi:peptidoglycan-associated lipoprotein